MHLIKRLLQFDAGHRVLRHESKCAHLHGHRYEVEVSVQSDVLDSVSRVVDFGVVKKLVGGWIDDNWDHNILLNSQDPLLKFLAVADARGRGTKVPELGQIDHATHSPVSYEVFAAKKPYLFKDKNPTAEVMAEELYSVSRQLLAGPGLLVRSVVVWETPNCCAQFTSADFRDKQELAR